MLVWLTEWQLTEDHLLIGLGDSVEWTVYPSDREWIARLFDDRIAIDWQYDTYGHAVRGPSLRVVGTVTELQIVRCGQHSTSEGIVPLRGEATLHPVADTSGAWKRATPLSRQLPTTIPRDTVFTWSYGTNTSRADATYGYVATLALGD